MKQILYGIGNFRIKVADFFHSEVNNTFNKTEFHFHGPVNIIDKSPKNVRRKIGFPPKEK